MILTKDNFSSVASENVTFGAGTIYKLLLQHKYTIETKEGTPDIRYLIKHKEVMAQVNVNDVIYYLHTNHTTYKLYNQRLAKVSKSTLPHKIAHATEYANILQQLQEIYIAKYLFKCLPLNIRVEYLKR